MRKGLFTRISLFYAVVILLSILFIQFYITRVIRLSYIYDLKKSLTVQIGLISYRVPFNSESDIDPLCKELKGITGARVTIINGDGMVMGDSDRDSALMDNHINRPEIQQAIISETGWSIRHSNTVNERLIYIAKRIMHNGEVKGFIRMAVPLEEVNSSINTLRFNVLFAVIMGFTATWAILLWQTIRIRGFVTQITGYSRSLADGALDSKLRLQGAGEFEEIADNLNRMSAELKETIGRSEEETNRLNVILRSIPDALLIISPDGIIEIFNDAAVSFFKEPALQGKPFIEVVRNPEFYSLMDRVSRDMEPGSCEMRIDEPEERFLSVRVLPLFCRERELSGFVAIFNDTTQIKRLEQVRKDFVANVSHEIKTPVTAIQGFAETLLDGAIDDRENALSFLNTIKSHSERLNRLVEDLLTLSKIELGVIKIKKTEVSLSGVMDNVIETLKTASDAKGLYLNKAFPSGEIKIMADSDRLIQILINLVDNSVKFTESGGIEVGYAREGEQGYIYVKDTGAGIPKKYIPRLGERFFRVDPSRSRELGGTGLGLAIVKHLIKAHGWTMKIDSREGTGTVVKVYIKD